MKRNADAYYNLVAEAISNLKDYVRCEDIREASDAYDAVHEIADNHVPHYYHEIFTVMAADGISHEFTDTGLMPETKDVTCILQARIYEALYEDMMDELDDIVQEYVDSIEEDEEEDE